MFPCTHITNLNQDKGNTVAIMNKKEYVKKSEEFIDPPYEEIRYNYRNK